MKILSQNENPFLNFQEGIFLPDNDSVLISFQDLITFYAYKELLQIVVGSDS